MAEIVKTIKLHLHVEEEDIKKLTTLTTTYMNACNYISEYIFNNGFQLSFMKIQDKIYSEIRKIYGLKSQFSISAIKTTAARYKTVKEQMAQKPYQYKDENEKWYTIPRTLDWLQRPINFHRPQADFVRGRDYSFITDKKTGESYLSLNSLDNGRIYTKYAVSDNFKKYFDGSWKFGTGKLVSLNGEWYLHIPMTKINDTEFDMASAEHIVGIDRGIRFLETIYDETGNTEFVSGKDIVTKRNKFQQVRSELQARGTKSAKRALKRISGRENRWMTDINHQLSKTLIQKYGKNTLFVIEDLTGVSFSDENLKNRSSKERSNLRSWSFYQLEQFLTYKANATGSEVLKVKADYTSQICPVCGRIHKENRKHDSHEYICDKCGYRSNDDRVGAMNIYELGKQYVKGIENPHFCKQ